MDSYDVVVIGAGPGGYVAAIRCAQLGLKTACIESASGARGDMVLGGTCLNVGCIPSKALLDSSHHYEYLRTRVQEHGITVGEVALDVAAMQKRKEKIVQTLTQGIGGLFKKNGVHRLHGHARLLPELQIAVFDPAGTETTRVQARHIIVATGSVPARIPAAPVDGRRVVDSTGALAFDAVPATLGVIGAGVIGLELGSVWRRLGSQVTIFEALADFLPAADRDVAKEAQKLLSKQGLELCLGAKVHAVTADDRGVDVEVEIDGQTTRRRFDKLIVAVGRSPNTSGLDPGAAGVEVDTRGFIVVDELCRTRAPGIYAIGDVVRGPMLAHKASEEGVAVAELIAGQRPQIDHTHIPWVIYTWPEIAWAGATEQSLAVERRACRVGRFPFTASGRARAMGETEGFIKIVADATSDAVLGVHILGPHASELIAEAVLAMEFGASAEDIARTVHAHPTLSESLHEAALGVDRRMIHL